MWHHSNKSNKSIKFTDDSLKCCICFIEFESLININSLKYESPQIREYYSIVINSLTKIVDSRNGKIVKSLGDRLLCYFLNFADINNEKAFEEVIECGFDIIDKREDINKELSMKNDLPPLKYFKISIDYGVVDLALAGDNYQLDVFGSTVNVCSKINSASSLSSSSKNEIIIGNNFYRVLKSFSNLINKYNFMNSGEFQITENIGYPTYNIKRKDTSSFQNGVSGNSSNKDNLENKISKKSFFFHKKNNKSKRIIIVDDDQEIVYTYKLFLENYGYHLISFIDPIAALDYIKNLSNFNDLLVILDIRMENLNGFQLHQQIKAIDPTIKIIFITVLDIADELLTIVPGLSKEQILRKPVNKKEFTNTVKNMLN
jgi:two-component system, OmpR family, response regulator ChvI